jgi:hypothetical protein
VRLNAEWTERIHRSAFSPSVKRFVPKPTATFPLRDGMVYVEELVEGTIAWKLAGKPQIEPVMLGEMCDFLLQFNKETAADVSVSAALFERLSVTVHAMSTDRETALLMDILTQRLRERTMGTDHQLVWSHGDFGYGNAIAASRTGSLCGIIDWDQAREDLAGVDLLNFLIAREQMRSRMSLSATFVRVGPHMIDQGFRWFDPGIQYEEHFPLTPRQRSELLGWFALRMAQRTAIYPSVLKSSTDEVHSILRWACTSLSE